MSFDAATVAQLRKRIAQEREKSVDIIIGGKCEDFSRYQGSVLYIKALDDVIVMIEEIQADLQKE